MKHNVWIVDDDPSIRWVLEKTLRQENFIVTAFENAESALYRIKSAQPDVLITDIRMPGKSGISLLDHIQKYNLQVPVIIMTAHSDLDSTVTSYKSGAFEYLAKPFDIDEAVTIVKRAITSTDETDETDKGFTDDTPVSLPQNNDDIIGEAPAMQEVFRAIGRLSQSNISVLINGESGTGKELVAHALHKHSPRALKPFIALNMAAIPKDLIESELFGHEKGAFTGASQQRRGRFEQADGGTLLLDEIGDMPAETQTRLLRVLQNGEFYRVGGLTPVKVDVRIIAATHQNLEELVQQHSFREDLFHRLNVFRLYLPTLNQRREDIPRLANHFLNRIAIEMKSEAKNLLPETIEYLCKINWLGNVRQLENCCRWIMVMAAGRDIHINDLPPDLLQQNNPQTFVESNDWEYALKNWAREALQNGNNQLLHTATPTFEKVMIECALQYTNGKKQEAALLLGWGRNTLTRKLKELNLIT